MVLSAAWERTNKKCNAEGLHRTAKEGVEEGFVWSTEAGGIKKHKKKKAKQNWTSKGDSQK
jgi:hypothetical protein